MSPGPPRWLSATALAALVLFAWPTARLLAGTYRSNPDYAHGPFVVAIATAAALQRRPRERDPQGRGSPGWGLAVALAGVLTVLAGRWYEAALRPGGLAEAFLGVGGLVLVLAGWALAAGGFPRLRRFAFPIGYLLCAAPWPVTLTDALTMHLKGWVTGAAATLLRAAGFLVYREGNVLHLPTVTIGVVDACSGLRSFWVLLALALALAAWRGLGPKRGLLLAALCLPVALAANLLRVAATAVLAAHVDPRLAEGVGHEAWGLAVFAVGAAVLTAAAWKLAPAPGRPILAAPSQDPAAAPGAWRSSAAVAALLLLGVMATLAVERHYPFVPVAPAERLTFDRFPRQVGDFVQVASGDLLPVQLEALGAHDRLVRTYRGPDGRTVRIWSLYWLPVRSRWAIPPTGPHRPEACYPAAGWRMEPVPDARSGAAGGEASGPRLRVFHNAGRTRLVLYRSRERAALGRQAPGPLTARLATLVRTVHDPVRTGGSRSIVALETDVAVGRPDALARLKAFAAAAAPLLPRYDVALAPLAAAGDGQDP